MRSFSTEDLLETMEPYLPITGFEPNEWLGNKNNLAYCNDKGDFGLFEYEIPGVYSGHYFFKSRGKEALKTAKEILEQVFNEEDVQVIRGFTPLKHLGARWMNKQLGFKSYGVVHTAVDICELVILTKQEWKTQ
jgi:hypothetical protein